MKGRRALFSLMAACATVCILTPSVARAANTTCANADFLFLGERGQYTIGASGGATPNLFFKTKLTASRSYAVMAWAPFQDAGEGGASLGVDLFSDSACTVSAPGSNASDYEPELYSVPGHAGDHDSIIPPADTVVYIRVNNAIASSYTAHVMIVETTLFSPWWFTGGTNQAYIEMRNNQSSGTSAEVTIYRANGTVCGTTTVNINGNGNAAVEVNTVGTCAAAVSGSAQISFPGTPGGMVANITTINVPNGTSFDSPFAPRMVWGTFSR